MSKLGGIFREFGDRVSDPYGAEQPIVLSLAGLALLATVLCSGGKAASEPSIEEIVRKELVTDRACVEQCIAECSDDSPAPEGPK